MTSRNHGALWGTAFTCGMAVLLVERGILAAFLRPTAAAEPLWRAFALGARFDAASVAYVLIQAFVASVLAARSSRARDVERWTIGLALTALVAIALVEFHFFREFHRRVDFVLFEYLDDPGTALGMAVAHVGTGWLILQVAIAACVVGSAAHAVPSRATRTTPRSLNRRAGCRLHAGPSWCSW